MIGCALNTATNPDYHVLTPLPRAMEAVGEPLAGVRAARPRPGVDFSFIRLLKRNACARKCQILVGIHDTCMVAPRQAGSERSYHDAAAAAALRETEGGKEGE